jgi:hypothetical protein
MISGPGVANRSSGGSGGSATVGRGGSGLASDCRLAMGSLLAAGACRAGASTGAGSERGEELLAECALGQSTYSKPQLRRTKNPAPQTSGLPEASGSFFPTALTRGELEQQPEAKHQALSEQDADCNARPSRPLPRCASRGSRCLDGAPSSGALRLEHARLGVRRVVTRSAAVRICDDGLLGPLWVVLGIRLFGRGTPLRPLLRHALGLARFAIRALIARAFRLLSRPRLVVGPCLDRNCRRQHEPRAVWSGRDGGFRRRRSGLGRCSTRNRRRRSGAVRCWSRGGFTPDGCCFDPCSSGNRCRRRDRCRLCSRR